MELRLSRAVWDDLIAVSHLVTYLTTLAFGVYALTLLEPSLSFEHLFFEAASALGTVGLSRGVTGDLGTGSKLVTVVLMYLGRVGPLTGLAVVGNIVLSDELGTRAKREEDIAV